MDLNYRPHPKYGEGTFVHRCVSVHTRAGASLLHLIILPLVRYPLWGIHQWLVPGPFWGRVGVPRPGQERNGVPIGTEQQSGFLLPGGSARRITGKLEKNKNLNFSSTTFTTVFKICLYARHFDSSVCPHNIFWRYFSDSSKLLKNYFINELDLTSFKCAAIKWFFKSLEELAKYHQKILCGYTNESKCLAYRHISKTVVKVV